MTITKKQLVAPFLIALVWLGLAPSRPLAALAGPSRQVDDLSWTEPVNLSLAGGTANPTLVIDSDGVAHILWEDVYAGAVYAHSMGQEWSAPVALDLPFEDYAVDLIADGQGNLHALWLDDEQTLFHQRVSADGFANAENWLAPVPLATAVANFDAAFDSQNRLQLAFVRLSDTGDLRAGVYGLRSDPGATAWSSPEAIFQSAYFRTLVPPEGGQGPSEPGRVAAAHIDIEVTDVDGSPWSYVTWDLPPLKRVYLARSFDGSQTWSLPVEIDAPGASSPYKLPQQLRVSANGRELLLFWQAGLVGGNCTEVFRASNDGGVTWKATGEVFPGAATCPQALEVLRLLDGNQVLLATLQDQHYLLAWNGEQWSRPQGQTVLGGVFDPVTFGFVEFACLRAAAFQGQIFAVMCDKNGNGDIWFSSRVLGAIDQWFAPATGWNLSATTRVGVDAVQSLRLSAGPGAEVYTLWAQRDAANADKASASIYYANWNGEAVTGPFPALSAINAAAGQLVTTVDGAGRLLAFWVTGTADAVYFSWVDARQAGTASSWSAPQPLPVPAGLVGALQVGLGDSGEISVLMGVPINEGRGLYLLQSSDRGATWSEPFSVFAGSAAGCAYVDRPRLAVGADGSLQALWTCSSLPGLAGPATLYLSRSTDRGLTWSAAELIAEGAIVWTEIVAGKDGSLHRLWQEVNAAGTVTWHAVAAGEGGVWNRPESIALNVGGFGSSRVAVDANGGLHLIQYLQPEGESPQLRYWFWDGAGWTAREALTIKRMAAGAELAFDALVDSAGRLVVVYAQPTEPDASGLVQYELAYASRLVEAAGTPAETEPAPAATAPPAAATAAVTEPTATAMGPTPTPAATLIGDSEAGTGGEAVSGLIVGALSAAALVVGVAIIGRRVRRQDT